MTQLTTVVERRFGPVPEGEFDPDRFLNGPQVRRPDRTRDGPNLSSALRVAVLAEALGSHP